MAIDLDKELTELRRDILTMGSLVEQRVGDAIEALLTGRTDIAQRVRIGDREVDEMDVFTNPRESQTEDYITGRFG